MWAALLVVAAPLLLAEVPRVGALLVDVAPGREGPVAFAREDDRLYVRVRLHGCNAHFELLRKDPVHGVQDLGPVEGDDPDAFALLNDDVLVAQQGAPRLENGAII